MSKILKNEVRIVIIYAIRGKLYKFKGHFNGLISTCHGYGFLLSAPLMGTLFAIPQHPHPPVFRHVRGTSASFPRQSTPPPRPKSLKIFPGPRRALDPSHLGGASRRPRYLKFPPYFQEILTLMHGYNN